MSNQNLVVRFDGYDLSYVDLNGNLVKIPAISGGASFQNPDWQNIKNQGMMPEGYYHVRQKDYQNIDETPYLEHLSWRIDANSPNSSWGEDRVFIEPVEGTNTFGRKGFSIHGGDTPGSSGCIDILNNKNFFEYFKSVNVDVTLVVDYSKYDTSIKNSLLEKIEKNKDFFSENLMDLLKKITHDYFESKINSTIDSIHNQFISTLNSFMPKDPLVIDLNGDGLRLGNWQESGVSFDLDGNGFSENAGWVMGDVVEYRVTTNANGYATTTTTTIKKEDVAPPSTDLEFILADSDIITTTTTTEFKNDDVFLVLDKNGNSVIDDISELFGNTQVSGFSERYRILSSCDKYLPLCGNCEI